jgi:hypothetical protein
MELPLALGYSRDVRSEKQPQLRRKWVGAAYVLGSELAVGQVFELLHR